MFVGIDVSASRGLDLCAIDERRRVSLLVKARDLDILAGVVRSLPAHATVAVDASSGPSRRLLPGADRRVAEHELRRIGIPLYDTPSREEAAPGWMRVGFALYRLLAETGHPVFTQGDGGSGITIEVYPHLSYIALSGSRRGRASKLEWSRDVLRGRVHGLPPDASQDALDAACAALTAWHFAEGRWIAFGDPAEGVIVCPEPRADLARPDRAGAGQLALPIEEAHARPRAIASPTASTFADRVAAIAATIPSGKVATFADLARWAGKPAAARAVGTIVAARSYALPCHRVVNAAGRPSPYPADAAERLRAEGVPFTRGRVDLGAARWRGPA